MHETSPVPYGRALVILLTLSAVCGWFGEMYVPSQMLAGDAAATAARLREHEGLFRLGFAAYLVEAFSDIVLAWLLYVLLRPVHRDLALLSAFFGLVSTTLFAVTKMFYFAAPTLLSGRAFLAAIPPAQLESLASLFLSLYAALAGLTMLFYGTGWIIRGWLTWRSGYLPPFLGAIMIVAGLGFVAKTLTHVLAPAWSSDLLLAPMFVNLIALVGWMLAKGVDRQRWSEAVARSQGPAAAR